MNSVIHRPISRYAEKLNCSEENEMSRISQDGMLLQAYLAPNEQVSLRQVALDVFAEHGQKEPTDIQLFRAKRAANNLIALGSAKAFPEKKAMTHVISTVSAGTQAAALMNLAIRQGIAKTQEDDVKPDAIDVDENTGLAIPVFRKMTPSSIESIVSPNKDETIYATM